MFSKLHPGHTWWQAVGVLSGEGLGPLDLRCRQAGHGGGGAPLSAPLRAVGHRHQLRGALLT